MALSRQLFRETVPLRKKIKSGLLNKWNRQVSEINGTDGLVK
jgi:hypothetical protein